MLNVLLAAAVPFQRLIDQTSPTHGFINRQALNILISDSRIIEAQWLHHYLFDFDHGCDWADTGWRNIGHMYDPLTNAGFRGWPNAVELLQSYWDKAVAHASIQEYERAFFYLGAAAHLVQDLCVPHHAAARVFAGHKQFEQAARRNRHHYRVTGDGIYDLALRATDWVIHNAVYTRQHYSHCVTADLDPDLRDEAIADLLVRAQRTTAGFVSFFVSSVLAKGGGTGWAHVHCCSLPGSVLDISKQPERWPTHLEI